MQEFYKTKIHSFFCRLSQKSGWVFFFPKYFDLNKTNISHKENISQLSYSDVSLLVKMLPHTLFIRTYHRIEQPKNRLLYRNKYVYHEKESV